MSRTNWWPILIVALALAAELAFLLDVPLPVRAVLVLGFLLIGPGMAFVRLLRIGRFSAQLTLGIALSLALDTVVAEVMVLAGSWNVSVALAVLVLLTVAGSVLQMLTAGLSERRLIEE